MTGFDETVPPETEPDRDETSAPVPTENATDDPAVDPATDPDGHSDGNSDAMAGDDDLLAGQIGPDPTR